MKVIKLLILLFASACSYGPRDHYQVMNESLRQCYVESDSYTGKNGKIQGSMTTSLMVESSGRVKSCEIIKNDFKDPNLNACVCGILKKSIIENSSNEYTIEVVRPINFNPVNT